MRCLLLVAFSVILRVPSVLAQQVDFDSNAANEPAHEAAAMRNLAINTLARYHDSDGRTYLGNLLQLQAAAGDYAKAQGDESIADAKVPLRVQWRNDSVLHVPVSPSQPFAYRGR